MVVITLIIIIDGSNNSNNNNNNNIWQYIGKYGWLDRCIDELQKSGCPVPL